MRKDGRAGKSVPARRRSKKTRAPVERAEAREAEAPEPPHIAAMIAIGASAGGLEALERFFDYVADDSDAAYVVIQHLDPNFRSMMDELLAGHSRLPIKKAETGARIEPNVIYLNPARQDMSIEQGCFRLHPSEKSGGLNLPINCFFESAAAQFGERAIGVILSGTGYDGTKGCEAIKKAGGRVYVQDPATAKFDSMPASVLAKDLADGLDKPENLPGLIKEHLTGDYHGQIRPRAFGDDADPYATIFAIVKGRYDIDFGVYKHATMERRIRRRMGLVGSASLTDYADFLSVNRDEVANLLNDLLVDVTAFFRDSEAFDVLTEKVVKPLVAQMGEDREIRVWIAGCSSGEEAYSIAICFAESAQAMGKPLNVKILATDIHVNSLGVASTGLYPQAAVTSLPDDFVERYFEREGESVRIRKAIRRMIVFSQHNILKDPPFARIDLLACRNVLIYFNEDAQKYALNLFHFSLKKGGAAFLGPSEALGPIADEFKSVSRKWRIFSKSRDVRLLGPNLMMLRSGVTSGNGAARSLELTTARGGGPSRDVMRATFGALKELLARYAPTGFLISRDGAILHIFGDASKYIALRPGVFSQKVVDLLPRELSLLVANGLGAGVGDAFPKYRRSIRRRTGAGEIIEVVTLEPLSESGTAADFILLTIEEKSAVPQPHPPSVAEESAAMLDESLDLRRRNQELAFELQSTEENLQSAIEELATSNEELQSTNEELMASNEELQSTNEELHSVNEELYSVTAEHQRKIDELIQVTLDMEHLLKATEIGTIFLDEKLNVRRFTPAAAQAFNLIPHDVGRPISHITLRFEGVDFLALLSEVGQTSAMREKEVTVAGRAYLLRVLPYRVEGADQSGFVVTLIDIDELKEAQAQLRELDRRQQAVLESMRDSIVSWDARTDKILFCNDVFASTFDGSGAAMIGRDIFETLGSSVAHYAKRAVQALKTKKIWDQLVQIPRPDGADVWRNVLYTRIDDDGGRPIAYVGCGRDVSEQVRYVAALEELSALETTFDQPLEAAIRPAIEIGARFLGLEHGMLSEIGGDRHRVVVMAGPETPPLKIGAEIKLPHDLCDQTCTTSKGGLCIFKANADMDWPELKPGAKATFVNALDGSLCEFVLASSFLTAHRRADDPILARDRGSNLRNYIGMRVRVLGKVYGSVSFYSSRQPFYGLLTDVQRGFVRQIAQWIGLKIETHRQRSALLESKGELGLIFDNVPQTIWHVDSSHRVMRANAAAARMIGRGTDDVAGADIKAIMPELDAHWREHDDNVLKSQRPLYGVVTKKIAADGAARWTSTDRIPHVDKATGANSMLIVSTDITPLKERERELEALNDKLDLNRERFERLYRQTPVMMCSFFGDRRIVEASDAWLHKTGFSREEVLGRDICDFLDPPSKERAQSEFLPAVWRGGNCEATPLRLVARDGAIIDAELSAFVNSDGSGEPSCLAVFVDVTARNRAESALERANQDLASANEGLEKFAHVASHDLQEPMRKISQFADILLSGHSQSLNEEGKYFVKVMSDSAVRMRRLVHDILAFSRAINAPVQSQDVALDAIVNDLVGELDVSIRDSGATIEFADLPVVRGDSAAIQQLFRNLLTNGIKYRRPEANPKIVIKAERFAADGCAIRVSDNGVGIHPSQKAKIFEPFARLHQNGKIDGTGLGLAICKSVCDRHGWAISVDSAPGAGTEFSIVLPARDLVAVSP